MAYLFGTLYRECFNGAQSTAYRSLFDDSALHLFFSFSFFFFFGGGGSGVSHRPVGIAGSHYIARGVDITGASQVNARTLDKIYVYLMNKNGGVGKPECRLRSCFFFPVLAGLANAHIFSNSCHVCRHVGVSYRVARCGMDRSDAHALDSAGHYESSQSPNYGFDSHSARNVNRASRSSVRVSVLASGVFRRISSMPLPSTLCLVCSLHNTSVFCYLLICVGAAIAAVTCLRSLAGCGFPLFARTLR
jgi:hypothetical protein